MEIIDLSREIMNRSPGHPMHPPVIITTWDVHEKPMPGGGTTYSNWVSFSDHACTHVDAPVHFDRRPGALSVDQMPLETFYTGGVCLDLSHVPLKHAVTVAEMEEAEERSGVKIESTDTVLVYLGTNQKMAFDDPRWQHDFAGLAPESVHWLADKGIGMFGVEAVSPAPEGRLNIIAHEICAERGFTHMEGLDNMDKVAGRGRFRFCGFPLRFKGGSASPIRAVAIFE